MKRGTEAPRQQQGLMGQQPCPDKLFQLTAGAPEMTEYVITEASLHQWLVFADRKCIASCSNEVEAEKAMMEHSGGLRSPEPALPQEIMESRLDGQ
jgi:hypothetical protein